MRVTFLALETYSMIGGLQQFNRRIIAALETLSRNGDIVPTVLLSGDDASHIVGSAGEKFTYAYGQKKFSLIYHTARLASLSDILALGHVNMLPVGVVAKIINPRLKLMMFVHGEDVWNNQSGRRMKFYEPMLMRFVDTVASVSKFTATRMSHSFSVPISKFTIFPNAVDPVPALDVFEGSRNENVILTVSRLAPHDIGKHHDSVIRALPRVIEVIPDVKYVIVGSGPLIDYLKGLAVDLNVSTHVDFVGRLSDEDLSRFYQKASVFVMPSEKEGFGIVYLEAWLRGVPVICGTEDASHEIIDHEIDGFAIHHDDIAGIAEKISDLLINKNKSMQMGQSGKEKVYSRYLMSNFCDNLRSLLYTEKQ